MTDNPNRTSSEMEDDPSFLRSRREAFLILSMWLCCFLYSVPYCYLNGYQTREPLANAVGPGISNLAEGLNARNRTSDSVTYPFDLGIPDWVFWGVITPWALCILATVIFCVFIFAEDELAPDNEEETSES